MRVCTRYGTTETAQQQQEQQQQRDRRRTRTRVPVSGDSAFGGAGGMLMPFMQLPDFGASMGDGSTQSYSYSSTTVWHGGSDGGYTYKKSETTRRLPGGVRAAWRVWLWDVLLWL